MQDNALYIYHCRPGYASQTLLIEFIHGAEHKTFIADLLAAIKEIQPRLEGRNNLWMHDELITPYTQTPGHLPYPKISGILLSLQQMKISLVLSK